MKRLLAIALALVAAANARADAVTITKGKDSIEFKIGKELVATYYHGDGVAKPYFYPMNAPGDIPVTRGWPMVKGLPKETTDHPHQKSAWFCHGDVIPEGLELKERSADKRVHGVDFWSEGKGHGKIVCVAVGDPKGGTVATRNEWRAPDGTKIMDEKRVISLHDLGKGRLFVLEIHLHASVCPITFGDTKEGSMGVRVNDEMIVKNGGHFYNAEGKADEKEVWGRPSAWCDYVGRVGGKTAGIAVFDDPENKHKAVWHARGYGLMAANPFGRDASFPSQKGNKDLVKLAKDGHLMLRYGVYLHAGDTKEGKVADAFETFKKRVD